jgi:RNA polymerase sigma-70 factor (ECF subfamily)
MDPEKSLKYVELIEQARKGDKGALEQLCHEVEQIIRSNFSKRYNSDELIEELLQETYLRLFISLPNLREPQRFSYFVTKIALHVHYDYLHNKYQSLETHQKDIETYSVIHASQNAFVVQPELEIQQRMDLERAFLKLSERTRKIIKLKMSGFQHKEIAKLFNLSVDAVKMIVYRGMTKLRSFFLD